MLAIVLGWARPAISLDPGKSITQYLQSSFNSESGLPQNSVHGIVQTTDGYMWFGTEEGLARFDGVRFLNFSRLDTNGLASDYITALASDPDGSLWVGTDSGLSHYKPSNHSAGEGVFSTLNRKNGLTGDNVTSLWVDGEGGLWVGTTEGLNRIMKGSVEVWTKRNGLPDLSVTALTGDGAGRVWIGTRNGLACYERGGLVTLTKHDGLPGNAIAALASVPGGAVWVGTMDDGITEIRQGRIVRSPSLPWKAIEALRVDHDGALWIAFDRHGIGRLYRDHLELYGTSRGLPSDRSTHALFEDREGSLWIGLLDAGVSQLRDGKFTVFGKREGLSGDYTGNILQAQDGSMWIGVDSNGLDHLLPDGRVEVWNRRNGLPNQAVFSLLETIDGSLWVGYRNGALARIRNGKISSYQDPGAGNASLTALFEDRSGQLWVGYFGKGLALFKGASFRHVTLNERISDITEAPDGAIWVATDGDGAWRYFEGKVDRFTSADGLPNNHVMCLYAESDGSVWAGTASGGLSVIRDRRIFSWTPKQGLPESTVGSILEDGIGNLWLGGDAGITRVAKDELDRSITSSTASIHAILYGTSDGLRSRETLYGSMPSRWRSRDGRLWFATIMGAATINPAKIRKNTVVPPVWIENVIFDSRVIPLEGGHSLPVGSGNLEFFFTAPTFVAAQQVRFRYQLKGFDREWISAADRRSTRYTNLPPGRYTFVVQAANSDGVWNEAGASFSFALRSPPTRTPLAYTGYGIVGLLLSWCVLRLRTITLIRRQQELTRIVADRTAQLEAEKTALENARHELQIQATHDSLTGLLNRAAILQRLESEIARAAREGAPLAVVIADLDHFKALNDNYGHLCGDDVLRESADRLRAAMRSYDLVGRYGGEEFLILVPGWNPELTRTRVDDLVDAIRSRPFQTGGREIHLTCSFGVATLHSDTESLTVQEILARADGALYAAKKSGRDCACFDVPVIELKVP